MGLHLYSHGTCRCADCHRKEEEEIPYTLPISKYRELVKFKAMWEKNKRVWFLNELGYFQGFSIFTLLKKIEADPNFNPFKNKALLEVEIDYDYQEEDLENKALQWMEKENE